MKPRSLVAAAVLACACNALLGNEKRTRATDDDGSTDPGGASGADQGGSSGDSGGSSSGGTGGTGGSNGGQGGAAGGTRATGGSSGDGAGGTDAGGTDTGGTDTGGTDTGGTDTGGTDTGGMATGGASGSGATGGGGMGGNPGGAGGSGGTSGAGGKGGAGGSGGGATCAGRAISFGSNGTGKAPDTAHARVMIDLQGELPENNAPRTVEFWAFVRSTDWVGQVNTTYEYGTQETSNSLFGLDLESTATFYPYWGPYMMGPRPSTMLSASVDQWVHFAMTFDGSAVRAYVNGILRFTQSIALQTRRTALTIGCSQPRFGCFAGYIDEFRVWRVARSATELMANYTRGLVGNETGLVGYWRFNEASGNTAADAVTIGGHVAHNGMLTASGQIPTFVTPAVPLPLTCP